MAMIPFMTADKRKRVLQCVFTDELGGVTKTDASPGRKKRTVINESQLDAT